MALSWDGLKKLRLPLKQQSTKPGDGPGTKCEGCGELLLKKTLDENLGVCAQCGYHHCISARRRINMLIDAGTFEERYRTLMSSDPLNFKGMKSYRSKLEESYRQTGEPSEMLVGLGNLDGRRVAVGASDNFFIQGSMGSVLGEKLCRITEDAIRERCPLILASGTGGGARMYEGMFSLMQMAKTSAALGKLHEAGLPFISICTDSTMGGVWASWASLGDIIIGEPRALIGFTGPRVIYETFRRELPEGFQSAEFLLEHGQLDMIVDRSEMKARLSGILRALCGAAPAAKAV